MSRSFNHSCGRACGICIYTAARNLRDEAAIGADERDPDAHAVEQEREYPDCNGNYCMICDPTYGEDRDRRLECAPLAVPLAEVAGLLEN